MQPTGVAPGRQRVAGHRVLANPGQAAGLPGAAAVGQVGQHGQGLVVAQAAVEQGRALAFGEAGLAGLAVQQASLLLALAGADGQVAPVALAVVGAVGVLTTEAAQIVVHCSHRPEKGENNQFSSLQVIVGQRSPPFNTLETPPLRWSTSPAVTHMPCLLLTHPESRSHESEAGQNSGRIDAVVTLEVDVPRSWLRRSRKGLWYSTGDMPPERIRRLFGFVELARAAG
jgi:hypothetical protein